MMKNETQKRHKQRIQDQNQAFLISTREPDYQVNIRKRMDSAREPEVQKKEGRVSWH